MLDNKKTVLNFFNSNLGKYYIFNVKEKLPIKCDTGKGLNGWSSSNYETEIKPYVNINSERYGISLNCGRQPNNDIIIGLDFDVMCINKENGKYEVNEYVKNLFNEFIDLNSNYDGVFSSSTQNNYGCFVKINDEQYEKLLKIGNIGGDLEVKIKKSHLLLPPSSSFCKVEKILRERKYLGNEIFLDINLNEKIFDWIYNYMKYRKGNCDETHTKKENVIIECNTNTLIDKKCCEEKRININLPFLEENNEKNDLNKIIEMCEILENKYINSYKLWFMILVSLKHLNNSNSCFKKIVIDVLFKKWEKYNIVDKEKEIKKIEKIWNNIYVDKENNRGGTLFYFAKMSNITKYIEIQQKYMKVNKNLEEGSEFEIANIFNELYGFNYLVFYSGEEGGSKNEIYKFNNIYWCVCNEMTIMKDIRNIMSIYYEEIIIKISREIQKRTAELLNNSIEINKDELIKSLEIRRKKNTDIKKKINSVSFVKTISTAFIIEYQREKTNFMFERNPNIICFNNLCYNISTKTTSLGDPNDYMILSTGYDYIKNKNDEKIEDELNELIKSIFEDKEEREFIMCVLASSLYGKNMEKLFMFNGSGGNGKGVLTNLLFKTLGDYAYRLSSISLTKPIDDGGNPSIANMSYKRLVITSEPDEKNRLHNGTIKSITGDDEVSARKLYKNGMRTFLRLTLILECNKRPLFKEEITDAELRRLYDIYFANIFKTNIEDFKNCPNVKKANIKYKDVDYINSVRCVFFNMLIPYFKKLEDENFNFDKIIPTSIKERTDDYMKSNELIYTWFIDNFETNEKAFVPIKYVFDRLCDDTETQKDLKKREWSEKGIHKKNTFVKYIEDHIFFKPYYSKKIQSVKDINSCLEEYKIKKKDEYYNAYNMKDSEEFFNIDNLYKKFGLYNKDNKPLSAYVAIRGFIPKPLRSDDDNLSNENKDSDDNDEM